MKLILHDEKTNSYMLRFDKGEDVVEHLTEFCEREGIKAGHFRAVGATEDIVISWYDLPSKSYTDKEFSEQLEIIAVTGNVAQLEGKSYLHMHGCFSNQEMWPVAGHIKRLVVGPTCEVILQKFEGEASREFSEDVGLNLLQ